MPLLLLKTVITALHQMPPLIALREDKSALGKNYCSISNNSKSIEETNI